MQKKYKGIKRIIKAFFYSMQGFKSAFTSEPAFRQEVFLTIILSPVAFYFSRFFKRIHFFGNTTTLYFASRIIKFCYRKSA